MDTGLLVSNKRIQVIKIKIISVIKITVPYLDSPELLCFSDLHDSSLGYTRQF